MTVCGRTDVGRERSNNEDAFLVADFAGRRRPVSTPGLETFDGEAPILLAVSDGMGGEAAGEVASATALESLQSGLADRVATEPPAAALRQSFDAANRAVAREGRTSGREGMGATLTAALLAGPYAFVATVGDSRAYLLRRGRLTRVTRDDSYAQFLLDRGALSPEQLPDFAFRNVILQAIGRTFPLSVPVHRIALCRGDRLLLCSDGLSSEVGDGVIASLLTEGDRTVQEAAQTLVATANAHGGSDNITVVLAQMDSGELPAPTGDDPISGTITDIAEPTDSDGADT